MRTPSPPYCKLDLAPPLADQFIVGVAPIDYGPIAESPRGISPRGAHRSGRKPLDLSGSCHRMKAAAFRLTCRFLPSPVDLSIPTPVTCSLRSTGITPSHCYYEAVRP
jgi:hypothetical protein